MIIDWRCSWRECEVLLERTGRMEYRVVIDVEGVEVEWNMRVGVGVHGKWLVCCMVERVITQSTIPVWIIGYHNTISGVDLGRELGRPLSRLRPTWSASLSPRVIRHSSKGVPWFHQCSSFSPAVVRSRTHDL